MTESPTKYVKPLPATVDEMMANRVVKFERTLNDHIDEIHQSLFRHDAKYTAFLDAVYDNDAVEGSLSADNVKAAECIREYASLNNRVPVVAKKKLATIVMSLNVVLRRYGMSRKERSRMVHGEIVPNDTNNE